ncbi:hypothetical protein THIOM_005049 [Candidatus Thiomargarita nelsonii]|uniref:Uncharacterized protein n=1 Tax=Candidatus Thiomargarita nelsonii TaxID=1003181 RepID=A0A176RU94_9GAMM|nr:hypothetical protein THIOM_005049 [Candidatus Thiomargarita nelsonii]
MAVVARFFGDFQHFFSDFIFHHLCYGFGGINGHCFNRSFSQRTYHDSHFSRRR